MGHPCICPSAPPESLRSPHNSGQNWAWSRSKTRFALPRTSPCTPGPPCIHPCCAGLVQSRPWGCPPSPVAHPAPHSSWKAEAILHLCTRDPMGPPNDTGQGNGFLLSPSHTGLCSLVPWAKGIFPALVGTLGLPSPQRRVTSTGDLAQGNLGKVLTRGKRGARHPGAGSGAPRGSHGKGTHR